MKLRTKKARLLRNCNPGQLRDATTGRCGPGIGIDLPRDRMPQIRSEDLERFVGWCQVQGVDVRRQSVPADSLSPTQKEFRQERVDAIPLAKLDDPILVSRDRYVLDGTHRWVKTWQLHPQRPVQVYAIDLDLVPALELMRRFPQAKFVENDLTVNPFVSEAQRRACYAADDPRWDCREWSAATKGKLLPKRKSQKPIHNISTKKAARAASGKRRANVARMDPSRTLGERRAFCARLHVQFSGLKAAVLKLFGEENVLGLVENVFCATGAGGGVDPHCSVKSNSTVVDAKTAKDTAKWIHKITSASSDLSEKRSMTMPTGKLRKSLMSSRPTAPVTLYRFERAEHNPLLGEKSEKMPLQSWSTNKDMVEFAVEAGEGLVMREKTFHPHEIFADLTNMPTKVKEEYSKLSEGADMDEVLVYYSAHNLKEGRSPYFRVENSYKETVRNAADWKPLSDPAKLQAFQEWLKKQLKARIQGQTQQHLWEAYVKAGFQKGAARSFDDYHKTRAAKAPQQVLMDDRQKLDFYAGTKQQFLADSFRQAETVEKAQLMASRTFDELENVTSEMSNKMSRVLTDGLVQGRGPREIADDMVDEVGIGEQRAMLVARTELIRAHAEGQLAALDNLGVEEVGVAVEWSTAGDERVCPLCESLEGVVLKIDEARGLIPRHPNCRCAFLPANVGEDDGDQKDTKRQIDAALEEGGLDPDEVDVDKDRPQSILNMNPNHDEKGRFATAEVDIEGAEAPPDADPDYHAAGVAKIKEAGRQVLASVDHKFLQEAGVLRDGKLSIRVGSHHDPKLQARGLTGTEGGFADDDKVTMLPTSNNQADVTHTLVHEIAHKWEAKHGLSASDDAYMWANIGDVAKLSEEDKSRWGYVASAGSAEPLVEAIAQSLHPHDRAFGSTSTKFNQHFPKSIEVAKQHLTAKGITHNTSFFFAADERYVVLDDPTANANPNHDQLGRFSHGDIDAERERLLDQINDGKLRGKELAKAHQERERLRKLKYSQPAAPQPKPSLEEKHTTDSMLAKLRQVDQASGGHNFVHLGDLRDAHPDLDRRQFDALLAKARSEGKITLSGAEGRHGIDQRDRDAGIAEKAPVGSGENLYLYASAKHVQNFNPNHDDKGQFSSGGGADVGSSTELSHMDVLNEVADTRDRWGYKESMQVIDGAGREFDVGGVKWREGGNCVLSTGHVTVYSKTAGKTLESVRGLTAHELMHGAFEKVYQKALEEQRAAAVEAPTKSGMKIRMDGQLYPEYAAEFPTFARIGQWVDAYPATKDQMEKEDGITDYSKAYWRDYAAGKCTFHIAVHETLAEIAGHHERTGVILGSKMYKEYYKKVRDEYRVLSGSQKARKDRGHATTNAAQFVDHDLWLDSDHKPTSKDKATVLRWWRADGTNGWATKT